MRLGNLGIASQILNMLYNHYYMVSEQFMTLRSAVLLAVKHSLAFSLALCSVLETAFGQGDSGTVGTLLSLP